MRRRYENNENGQFNSWISRTSKDTLYHTIGSQWETNRKKIIPVIIGICMIFLVYFGIYKQPDDYHEHTTDYETIWYMADIEMKSISGYEEMVSHHIGSPCRQLSSDEIENKRIDNPQHYLDDLTMISHILCYYASEEARKYPNSLVMVTPNMLHITTLKATNEVYPEEFLNDKSRNIIMNHKNLDLENLCLLAVINPNQQQHDPNSQHVENDLSSQLKFKHKTHKLIHNATFYNYEELTYVWDKDPKLGQCAIMINPVVNHPKPILKKQFTFNVPFIDNVAFSDLIPESVNIIYKTWKNNVNSFSFSNDKMNVFEEYITHVINFINGDFYNP